MNKRESKSIKLYKSLLNAPLVSQSNKKCQDLTLASVKALIKRIKKSANQPLVLHPTVVMIPYPTWKLMEKRKLKG